MAAEQQQLDWGRVKQRQRTRAQILQDAILPRVLVAEGKRRIFVEPRMLRDVLQSLASGQNTERTLADVARDAGVSLSTLDRTLKAAEAIEVLSREKQTKRGKQAPNRYAIDWSRLEDKFCGPISDSHRLPPTPTVGGSDSHDGRDDPAQTPTAGGSDSHDGRDDPAQTPTVGGSDSHDGSRWESVGVSTDEEFIALVKAKQQHVALQSEGGASSGDDFGTPAASRGSINRSSIIDPKRSAFDRSDRSERAVAMIDDRAIDEQVARDFFGLTIADAGLRYDEGLRAIGAKLGRIPDRERYNACAVAMAAVLAHERLAESDWSNAINAASNGRHPWRCLAANMLAELKKLGRSFCKPRGLWDDRDDSDAPRLPRFSRNAGDGSSLPELIAIIGREWQDRWANHLRRTSRA